MKYKTLIAIFYLVCIYFLFYMIEYYEESTESMNTRTLETDGFCVLYDPLYSKNSELYPCKELQQDILNRLPNQYVFIDYVYKINNVALSTFHRDVTSSQHNYDTVHPVYTVILYKYTGDLLSVCPRSHKDYPFASSSIYNISGNPGTVFLFDCDLLHAGQTNQCKDREVLQYKVCHREDLQKLHHLQHIRTEKTDICILSYYNEIMRKLSYYFEFPINYLFYPLMIKRENTNSIIGAIQTLIPVSYYNNSY